MNKRLKKYYEEYINTTVRNKIRKKLNPIDKNGNKYNAFITINPNRPNMNITILQESIDHFYNNIACRLLRGSKFYDADNKKWINYTNYFNYYGFLEYTKTYSPHYHLIAYIDPRIHEYLKKIIERFWRKQIKSGTIDLQFFTPDNYEKTMEYCTKSLNQKDYKNYIIFPPSKSIQ